MTSVGRMPLLGNLKNLFQIQPTIPKQLTKRVITFLSFHINHIFFPLNSKSLYKNSVLAKAPET